MNKLVIALLIPGNTPFVFIVIFFCPGYCNNEGMVEDIAESCRYSFYDIITNLGIHIRDIHFDFDKSDIREDEEVTLSVIVNNMLFFFDEISAKGI